MKVPFHSLLILHVKPDDVVFFCCQGPFFLGFDIAIEFLLVILEDIDIY